MVDRGSEWCKCGASWVTLLTFTFFDLLWVIGAGWNREYAIVCSGCETTKAVPRAEVEAQLGNRMPLRYRYGWAVYLGVFLVVWIVAASHHHS